MYTQTFLVTSVRGRVFAPQTAASESLSFFGAKMPLPAFFMAAAIFFPLAFDAVFPRARFSAVIFLSVAFVFVVFGTVVFATVVLATVLVVVVIAIEGRKCKHALREGQVRAVVSRGILPTARQRAPKC